MVQIYIFRPLKMLHELRTFDLRIEKDTFESLTDLQTKYCAT